MDNLFDPEHLLYGLAGAAVIGLLGYYIGLAVFAMSASAASYNTNVTAANFFIARFSPLPMIGTIIGSAIGLFGGIIYSRERQRSPVRPAASDSPAAGLWDADAHNTGAPAVSDSTGAPDTNTASGRPAAYTSDSTAGSTAEVK